MPTSLGGRQGCPPPPPSGARHQADLCSRDLCGASSFMTNKCFFRIPRSLSSSFSREEKRPLGSGGKAPGFCPRTACSDGDRPFGLSGPQVPPTNVGCQTPAREAAQTGPAPGTEQAQATRASCLSRQTPCSLRTCDRAVSYHRNARPLPVSPSLLQNVLRTLPL